ncbi:hypothetical protein IMZ31_22860 (plasmid) [Pontibacillus sp. ALD_SL1]|uniref:hypothetical protein n=1 Tax=Pontibacillus sp. ALD_SL1 TaxID=2777185 RepID=UPI001A972715|nr:hypothetical protein [Pontibacillus sp. ALD_SL1]QST02297.1 hypothetical protein IMZ31_22860 [Pontibacillus sp. ALD_SL1]
MKTRDRVIIKMNRDETVTQLMLRVLPFVTDEELPQFLNAYKKAHKPMQKIGIMEQYVRFELWD